MYGKPVTGEYYFELPSLKKDVASFVDNKINVLIIGPRRFGKTSFLKSLMKDQRAAGKFVIDIDAFNVLSHKDFLNQLINAIKKEKSAAAKFFDWMKGVRSLSPSFSYEMNPHSGNTEFSINFKKLEEEEDVKQAILTSLEGLKELQVKSKLLISIDEFQKIGELEDGGWLEATLRSTIQENSNLTFIFTGSRRSILEDMFNNPAKPFYKSCKQIYFPNMGSEFTDWIISRFSKLNIVTTKDCIDYLRMKVADTPNYVQEACFHLVSHGHTAIKLENIDEILNIIASQGSYIYESLLNTLSTEQKKCLRLFVTEGRMDYSREILNRYEIKRASNIQAATTALISKQILVKDPSGHISFDDPMFEIWMKKMN